MRDSPQLLKMIATDCLEGARNPKGGADRPKVCHTVQEGEYLPNLGDKPLQKGRIIYLALKKSNFLI